MNQFRYQEIADNAETQPLSGIWSQLQYETDVFVEKRELFLKVLEHLLREGRIKLHKNGVFLQTSVDELVQSFRAAWPASENPYPTHPDADFYLWFFDPACPAGVAWRQADGQYLIAD